jgi:hypothetical protein
MNKHVYLRAYLAGIAVPTVFLLVVVMPGYTILRYAFNFSVPVERVIVFPMAVVPNLWGLWNIVFVAWREKFHMPIGLHGMLLPFLLAPLGITLVSVLDFSVPHIVLSVLPILAPVAVALYYLAWKYLVNGLNAVLGIA